MGGPMNCARAAIAISVTWVLDAISTSITISSPFSAFTDRLRERESGWSCVVCYSNFIQQITRPRPRRWMENAFNFQTASMFDFLWLLLIKWEIFSKELLRFRVHFDDLETMIGWCAPALCHSEWLRSVFCNSNCHSAIGKFRIEFEWRMVIWWFSILW